MTFYITSHITNLNSKILKKWVCSNWCLVWDYTKILVLTPKGFSGMPDMSSSRVKFLLMKSSLTCRISQCLWKDLLHVFKARASCPFSEHHEGDRLPPGQTAQHSFTEAASKLVRSTADMLSRLPEVPHAPVGWISAYNSYDIFDL